MRMPVPPMRNVDAFPVEIDGETRFCLSDPLGYVEDQVVVAPVVMLIVSLLDGERDVPAICSAFHQQTGHRINETDAGRVITQLDELGFLESPRFAALREETDAAFMMAGTRPAYLAGRAYPEEPSALREYVESFFTRPGGPGRLPGTSQNGKGRLHGLVVPHIDFERGWEAYARGYLRLAESPRPDAVIVFGVAHCGPPVPFVLTRKAFETPLGTVPTDAAMVDALADACSWDPYAYEWVHRTEHSIEFQAVMLAHLFGEAVPMIPVLCSQFGDGRDGAIASEVETFLAACRTYIETSGRNIAVVAGADLAHVGRRFGDPYDIDDGVLAAVKARDDEDLAHAARCDAAGWYQSVLKDGNERRVCGLNCIYATLAVVAGQVRRADTLFYGYAPDPAGGVVTFADVALY